MKKYISLEIKANVQLNLIHLLEELKTSGNKVFTYQKKLSEDFADNIFKEKDKVGCFKTRRKSLFESVVWMVFDGDALKVTNITSSIERNLGVVNYNVVLNSFFNDFVSEYISEGLEVTMTSENITIQESLNEETYQKLSIWEATCNKENPISNEQALNSWTDFIISLYRNGDVLTSSDFQQWLQEDKKWPTLYNSEIEKLGWLLDYSVELLGKHQ